MKKYTHQKNMIFLSLLAVVLGFTLMVSVHTYQQMLQQRATEEETNTEKIIGYIKDTEAETTRLEQEIAATREQLEAIQVEQEAGLAEYGGLAESLAQLNAYAGLTKLSGPGIIITLDDNRVGAELAQKTNPATYNAEHYIVHDKDLLYTVRALAPYAEAIAINDVRIIDTTSIRCVGTVIMVNSQRLAAPYIISIIGDADALTSALKSLGRYKQWVAFNMPFKVTSADELTIPAYTGGYPNTYSSPRSN